MRYETNSIHVKARNPLRTILRYVAIDYYCRTFLKFMAAMLFCALFFYVFVMFGGAPIRLFFVAIVVFLSIGFGFMILLCLRVVLMHRLMSGGVVAEAEVEKLMLFGHVFYDYEKAVEVISELAKKGMEACIRIKAIQICFGDKEKFVSKICYFYNQPYSNMRPIVKKHIPILLHHDGSSRFLIFPDLL